MSKTLNTDQYWNCDEQKFYPGDRVGNDMRFEVNYYKRAPGATDDDYEDDRLGWSDLAFAWFRSRVDAIKFAKANDGQVQRQWLEHDPHLKGQCHWVQCEQESGLVYDGWTGK